MKQTISSVTKTIWYDQEAQAVVSNVNLERYASLKKLIEKWSLYRSSLGAVIDKYELISIGICKEFITIDELIPFLETNNTRTVIHQIFYQVYG